MSAYELIEAQPSLCLPACLEIVIRSSQFGRYPDQAQIGAAVGVTVDSSQIEEIGVSIEDLQQLGANSLREWVASMTYLPANTFEEWELIARIRRERAKGTHAIVALSAGALLGGTERERGHAVVVGDIVGDKVFILDPGPGTTGERVISEEELYWAARARHGGVIFVRLTQPTSAE